MCFETWRCSVYHCQLTERSWVWICQPAGAFLCGVVLFSLYLHVFSSASSHNPNTCMNDCASQCYSCNRLLTCPGCTLPFTSWHLHRLQSHHNSGFDKWSRKRGFSNVVIFFLCQMFHINYRSDTLWSLFAAANNNPLIWIIFFLCTINTQTLGLWPRVTS